jgi:hypothetical protein
MGLHPPAAARNSLAAVMTVICALPLPSSRLDNLLYKLTEACERAIHGHIIWPPNRAVLSSSRWAAAMVLSSPCMQTLAARTSACFQRRGQLQLTRWGLPPIICSEMALLTPLVYLDNFTK